MIMKLDFNGVADAFRQRILDMEYTEEYVAKKLNISVREVQQLYKGESWENKEIDFLARVCDVLNCSSDSLLENDLPISDREVRMIKKAYLDSVKPDNIKKAEEDLRALDDLFRLGKSRVRDILRQIDI